MMAAVQEHVRATMHLNATNAAQEDVQRETRQTQRRAGSKVLNRMTLFFCCAVSFASVWFVASQGAAVYRVSYANTLLQAQINQQEAKNAAVSAQVDQLKQPSRILNAAVGEYHMVYKNPVVIPSTVSRK